MMATLIEYLPSLFTGMLNTLMIAILSLLLGSFLTLFFTLSHLSKYLLSRYSIIVFSLLMRGLPEILILFGIHHGGSFLLSTIFGNPIEIHPIVSSIITLSLIFSVYGSKLFYPLLLTIASGQKEAGKVLGMTSCHIWVTIILPQVWQKSLPAFSNLWVTLLKDTALISLVGVMDLTSSVQFMVSKTQKPFTLYLMLAGMYLLLSLSSEQFFKKISKTNRLKEVKKC